MRLADCFIPVFIQVQAFRQSLSAAQPGYEEIRHRFEALLEKAVQCATEQGYDNELCLQAKFPVAAYVDEQILCSHWEHKPDWQKNPLQKHYFGTTNAGAQFYERLGELSKKGNDLELREVFALCLGMGFRGRYFALEDQQQYEKIKEFNLACLLPEQEWRNLDTALLFPMAYAGQNPDIQGKYKPRTNIFPYVVGIPSVVLVMAAVVYHVLIVDALDSILALVQ